MFLVVVTAMVVVIVVVVVVASSVGTRQAHASVRVRSPGLALPCTVVVRRMVY